MLGKDGLEGTRTTRRVDVANDADDNHWRRLDDGDRFDDLLLVDLRAGLVDVTNDVRHAGLVAHKGGEMNRFAGIILRERLDFATRTIGALLGQEADGAVTRCGEFTMRHLLVGVLP